MGKYFYQAQLLSQAKALSRQGSLQNPKAIAEALTIIHSAVIKLDPSTFDCYLREKIHAIHKILFSVPNNVESFEAYVATLSPQKLDNLLSAIDALAEYFQEEEK